ncbi:hypothetical protein ACWEO4_21020 [Streptomyces sp. NPDC004393]
MATGQRLDVLLSLAKAAFDTYTREAPRMRGMGLLGEQVPQDAPRASLRP